MKPERLPVNGIEAPAPHGRRQMSTGLVGQVDGGEHHWFEDREPPCTLLVFVDDVTGKLMHLRFVPSENTLDYLRAVDGLLREMEPA